jgi:hypothetical protein
MFTQRLSFRSRGNPLPRTARTTFPLAHRQTFCWHLISPSRSYGVSRIRRIRPGHSRREEGIRGVGTVGHCWKESREGCFGILPNMSSESHPQRSSTSQRLILHQNAVTLHPEGLSESGPSPPRTGISPHRCTRQAPLGVTSLDSTVPLQRYQPINHTTSVGGNASSIDGRVVTVIETRGCACEWIGDVGA